MFPASAAGRFLLLALALLALAGCNRTGKPSACEKPKEYHEQASIAPVDVPDDLDAPNPDDSVRIPDLPGLEDGPARPGPCLEEPPDYFDTSPV
jgi:uncharacterized lipoprotein